LPPWSHGVGLSVGADVGETLGELDGDTLGDALGDVDGLVLGRDGELLGLRLGLVDGLAVGAGVGARHTSMLADQPKRAPTFATQNVPATQSFLLGSQSPSPSWHGHASEQ